MKNLCRHLSSGKSYKTWNIWGLGCLIGSVWGLGWSIGVGLGIDHSALILSSPKEWKVKSTFVEYDSLYLLPLSRLTWLQHRCNRNCYILGIYKKSLWVVSVCESESFVRLLEWEKAEGHWKRKRQMQRFILL